MVGTQEQKGITIIRIYIDCPPFMSWAQLSTGITGIRPGSYKVLFCFIIPECTAGPVQGPPEVVLQTAARPNYQNGEMQVNRDALSTLSV